MENTSQGAAVATPEGTSDETASQATGQNVGGGTPAEANGQGDAVKAAAAEAKRRLKIDNEEVDEDEVIKVYKSRKSHQQAANKELQEGKKLRKQNEEFISMMKDKAKLFEAIKKLGHDPRALSEEYLASELEHEMLDPREKELKAAKAQLRAYQETEKAQKEAREKAHADEMRRKFSDDYSKQFVDALKSTGLPPTKPMVAEMAKYIKRAADVSFEMTALEAAKLVKEDAERAWQSLYGEADADTLVKLIGEQGLQKVRTFDTSRLKNPADLLKTPEQQGEPQRKREGTKRMTPEEWRAFNRK